MCGRLRRRNNESRPRLARAGHRNSSSRGPQAAGRAENFAQEFTGNWASKCGRMSGPTRAARSLTIWCLLEGGDSRRRLRCHALAFPLAGVAVQLPPQPGLRARGGRYALTPRPSPRGRGELSDSLSELSVVRLRQIILRQKTCIWMVPRAQVIAASTLENSGGLKCLRLLGLDSTKPSFAYHATNGRLSHASADNAATGAGQTTCAQRSLVTIFAAH